MPYENKYLALCKETGLVRSGDTLEEARDALISSTKTLVSAVIKDPRLEPSLKAGLPFRYRVLFDWTVFKMLTRIITCLAMNKLLYQRQPISDFNTSVA